MNIAGIDYESVKDGVGVRTVIYVSGCSHNCYRCHNPQTHDINYGIPFTEELQNEIMENIRKRPFISGLTWSGGDPLHENNINDVLSFTDKIRLSFAVQDADSTLGLLNTESPTHYRLNPVIFVRLDICPVVQNYEVSDLAMFF